ncbi:MAG: hypothetical protein LT070_03715 [Solirubrobacteraceae bacterium]|nr:hypothetical protein [Solirubrobacteraceae bacterium]
MDATAAAPDVARPAGARGALDRLAGRVGLDAGELACLAALTALGFLPLLALLSKGRALSGADGLLATDQMQYLAWIREAGAHVLIGNPWDLAPGERRFLHPGLLLSGLAHRFLGVSIPLSYILWKPVAIAVSFAGCLLYVRRLVAGRGARHVALALALLSVMPVVALVAWTGWGGKPRQYTFGFISGEMWSGHYLWGYVFTAIAVFLIPLVLLGLERWREERRPRLLALCALGALLVMWLQPWQGAELAAIVVGVELLRALPRLGAHRPSWAMVATVCAAVALPAAYYLWLSRVDPGWRLAGNANSAGAQALWSWPWWAIVATVAPLAAPAALAYRLPAPRWQDVAVRLWPLAVLAVYLAPVGTFPYHSFQGLALPLAILAVIGVLSLRARPPAWAVVLALVLMILPGTIHKGEVLLSSVRAAGDPYWVFPGEIAALDALERDRRPGGVLGPTYASLLVPPRTGRETYVGPFSWTPDWSRRAVAVNDLFEGRLTGAAARRLVIASRARWLLADCRPLDLPALERSIAALLARPPQRFGCATLYELRFRPEMARAAGPPDA